MNLLQLPEESPPYPPKKARISPFIRLLAAFTLGFLLGNIFMLTGAAKRIDQLQLDNDALTDLVYNLETNVKTLEEAARSRQAQTIQNVRVIYAGNERPATRQQLEKEVQRLAETLRGLKLSEVSPEIVAQIFDGRIVTTDEGRFVLQLRWLILGQETSVSVTADPLRSL